MNCLFPPLNPCKNDERASTKHIEVIDLLSPRTRDGLNPTQEIIPPTVYQIAWALLLQAYTGTNQPVFGCDFPRKNHKDDQDIWICSLDLDDQDLIVNSSAFAAVGNSVTSNGSTSTVFNTAVLRKKKDEIQSEVRSKFVEKKLEVVLEVELATAAASLVFSSSILSTEQATSVAATFAHIATQMVLNPTVSPRKLDICSKHDYEILFEHWNKSGPSRRLETRVQDMIFNHQEYAPTHVAISAWDGELSYGKLDSLSSSLAAYLVTIHGVRSEVLVPLCFEKSKWIVIAMLGVIKAGGGYVFLDPSYPRIRMETIYKDVDATIILAGTQTAGIARSLTENVIVIDEESSGAWQSKEIKTNCPDISPRNVLYAAFTSGSTGKPKGIMVEHGAFCTRAVTNGVVLGLTRQSRVLQFASYAFDVSHRDILFTLIHNGTICIPSETDRMNNLERFINLHHVNWASLTPSVAGLIDPEQVKSLKTLVLAGEAMSMIHRSTWAEKVRLMNAYGPSECIAISCIRSQISLTSKEELANIGKGVGSVIWIVLPQDANRLAPIGAIGELVIETAAISRGYIKNETETKTYFPNELEWTRLLRSRGEGCGLYKTGDLARLNFDGTITFLGRKDDQVKINGQRVELAEIEHHIQQSLISISSHYLNDNETPTTLDVVAVVDKIVPKDGSRPILVAFVYCSTKVDPTNRLIGLIHELKSTIESLLSDVLPRYMIPDVFFPIKEIPRTGTGKTNRRALRELGASMTWEDMVGTLTSSEPKYRAPETENEKQLQELFMAVLHLQRHRVGADNSFFRLEGDSIAAMRLVSAARRRCLHFTVIDVFRNPRLCDLARLIDQRGAEEVSDLDHNSIPPFSLLNPEISVDEACHEAASLCGILDEQIADILPCTPLQEGLLAMTAKSSNSYIRNFRWQIRNTVNVDQLKKSWEMTVKVVPALRTRIIDLSKQGLVQVVVDEDVQWIYDDSESQANMGLGTPLAKHSIITTHDKVLLSLTVHHAVYDGWSISLILDTVEKYYIAQEKPRLAPFAGFIKSIVQMNHQANIEFWRRQFADLDSLQFPSLPESFSYEPRADRTLSRIIQVNWSDGLEYTPATAIRATLATLISRYTNCPDAVFGATVIGRQAAVPGVEIMPGPTFTTFPVRVMIDENESVCQFQERIHNQATDMIPHEQTGLQKIRTISQETHQACQFQTLLLIQPVEANDSPTLGSQLFFPEPNDDKTQTENRLKQFTSYALMFRCELRSEGMRLRVSFDPRVLCAEEIERMGKQFEYMLKQVCLPANRSVPLKQIKMTTTADLSDIWAWNRASSLGQEDYQHLWNDTLTYHQLAADSSNSLMTCKPWILTISSDEQRPAAIGCVGELWLEANDVDNLLGAQPSRTAVIENPRWLLEGIENYPGGEGRLYKTGELVKYSPDGRIESVGRIDDGQSRINGRRVNLIDVEREVHAAMVDIMHKATGHIVAGIISPQHAEHPMLVAFLLDASEETTNFLTKSTIDAIDKRLCDSSSLLVRPHAYGSLKGSTTTLEPGDILRQKAQSINLRDLIIVESLEHRHKQIPQTKTEQQLRDIWASVLGIIPEKIGAQASFFRLGGDSITAMRLVSVARKHGVAITVADIFGYPQLNQMAKIVNFNVDATPIHDAIPFSLLNLSLDSSEEIEDRLAELCNVQRDADVEVQDAFPCTPLQEGLISITMHSSGGYIARKILELQEQTDIKKLAQSWAEIVNMVPILRTRIVDLPGQGLIQVVFGDSCSWKTGENLDLYIEEDNEQQMGLGQPLARFGMVDDRSRRKKYFILTIHHAIYDGWLISLLLDGLSRAYYEKERMNMTPFSIFIKAISSIDPKTVIGFWEDQLNGLDAPVFPDITNEISSPRTDKTTSLLIDELHVDSGDTTISTAIRAAWSILCAKYNDSNEVLFGATVTGRQFPLAGIEVVVGPTIATVPVRVIVNRENTVDQFLQQVQGQIVKTIPFEQTGLQNIQCISTDAYQACRFQTLLVVHPADDKTLRDDLFVPSLPPVSAELVAVDPYALVLECKLLINGVRITINYDSRIMKEEQVARLIQQFGHVLRIICAGHKQTKIKNLDAQSPTDLRDIWKWNAEVPKAPSLCVQEAIGLTTHRQPQALAIEACDGQLTYQQLDSLATGLAKRLVVMGVGAEVFVPLLFKKSKWTPVAMLAVMKAGGAFVLLDPNHPMIRLKFICEDVGARMVVSSQDEKARAADLAQTVLSLGGDQDCAEIDGNPLTGITGPQNTLYAVFTSGTTGKPKGALVQHDAFLTNALAYNEMVGLGSDARILQFSSYSFDVCISDILFTLIGGACVCIPSESESKDNLAGAATKYNANWADLTPSVLRTLSPSNVPTIKTVVYGGEAPSKGDILSWCERVRLINVYGPAECSVLATVQPKVTAESDPFNIGLPIGGVCWIVDPRNSDQLVPVGAVGELVLEGPLLGQGYINNSEKTEQAFVSNPKWLVNGFAGHAGREGTVYKTGDLVRYVSDGTLQFLGRKDTQVKLRGQRVELGEVEYHVKQALEELLHRGETGEQFYSPDVVAEILHPERTGRPTLVVFISLHKTISETRKALNLVTMDLEQRLEDLLPAYMVPSAFISVERIPLGSTGKTDRRQLRELGEVSLKNNVSNAEERNNKSPSSHEEHVLLEVWMDVLNLPTEAISVDSPFIQLGGDSITAMQVVSRCRSRNICLTASDVLRCRTIEKLARCCTSTQPSTKIIDTTLTIEEQSWGLAPAQCVFFDAHPEGMNHFNQSFFLRIKSPFSYEAIKAALSMVVKRHPMLRARFNRKAGNEWQQRIVRYSADSFLCCHHLVDRSEISLLAQSRQECLDIRQGPVFAADTFILPSGEQILLLSTHHLVVDLVSWRIIWHDLEQCLRGIYHSISRPITSFQAWSKTLFETAQSLSPSNVLPYNIDTTGYSYWEVEQSANVNAKCETYTFTLDQDTTALLLGQCNQQLATEPIEILLAMLVYSFRRVFVNRQVPPVFLEGHGRESLEEMEIDLSETVGWFTTIFPVNIPCEIEHSIADIVKYAKDIRRSVAGKGLPYCLCRYLTTAGRQTFMSHDKVEILLNYDGIYQQLENDDSLFSRVTSSEFLSEFKQSSPNIKRIGLVELNIGVRMGQLNINWGIHKDMRHQGQLLEWMELFAKTLREASHELLMEPRSFTLSDFPLLHLSYDGLSQLEKAISKVGIPHHAVDDIYPCTPMQAGILISVEKGAASYINYQIWKCVAPRNKFAVCPKKLEAAWKRVVHHHSILRTIFVQAHTADGIFAQVVVDHEIQVHRIKSSPEDAAKYLEDLSQPSFAPGQPNVCFTISQDQKGDVFCRLDMNHALNDGDSTAIVVSDLARAYEGATLPPAPSFKKLIQHLDRTPSTIREQYWVNQLMGTQICRFPERENSRISSMGKHDVLSLDEHISRGIHAFCLKRGITRSVFAQIVWALALSWYTGMNDVCFGYMASGRDAPVDNIDRMVGPLANILISRINVKDSLEDALAKTATASIEHLAYQHTSLAKIQHNLRLGHLPLFNTCVSVREAVNGKEEEQLLSLEDVGGNDPHEFAVAFGVVLNGSTTELNISYRKDSIHNSTAQELQRILDMAIAHVLHHGHSSKIPMSADFFQFVAGENELSVTGFWRRYFDGLDTRHFPSLPRPSYSPQAKNNLSSFMTGFKWNNNDLCLSTAVRTAWAVLHACHTNSSDVIFGIISEIRAANLTKMYNVILPLRVVIKWDSTIVELTKVLENQALELNKFVTVGMHQVQRVSEEAEQGYRFQTLLVEAEGVNSALNATDQFGLIAQYLSEEDGLHFEVTYDPEMIEKSHVERILWQLEHMLRQLQTRSSLVEEIRNFSMISSRDLQDIWTWNSFIPAPVEECMHERISAVAERQPDAQAVCAWDGELTYKEVEELSTRLAMNLVSYLQHGTIVPLFFEKSAWTVIAMIGIMKAGGCSLALDVTQPTARLADLLDLVQPGLILSSVANEDMARQIADLPIITVDRLNLQRMTVTTTLPTVKPSDLLYIIFTSGSTGKPKGTLISHANFASATHHQKETWQFGPGSRVFDAGSYAFDVSWGNVLHTLSSGGCICIPEAAAVKEDIIESLRAYKATHTELTPSLARTLVPHDLPDLKCFISSGEALDEAVLERWSGVTRILNAYGPAECSAVSTVCQMGPNVIKGNIGRGLGINTWVASLQNNGQELAPLYAVGELCLEGPLVGQGYFNDHKKTNEAFINGPQWLLQGGRRSKIYKTGDLVRYHSDGSLIFIGRKDTQVKIRGQRVELAEVESHVRQALINASAMDGATLREMKFDIVAETITPCDGSHSVLVVFVCLDLNYESQDRAKLVKRLTAGLDEALAKVIPAYMIPSAYIAIDELPLTASGKTDRLKLRRDASSLTREDLAHLASDEPIKRPASTLEEIILQRICSKVLCVSIDSIGLNDSFFRLGGDSIAAINLVAMARNEGWTVTIGNIFSHPRLSDLACTMRTLQPYTNDTALSPFSLLPHSSQEDVLQVVVECGIENSMLEDAYPCTPLQEGLMAMTAEESDAYVCRMIFELSQDVDLDHFRIAWKKTIAKNPILRTRIFQTKCGLTQVILRNEYEWFAAETLEKYVDDDCNQSMGIGEELLRLGLVHKDEKLSSFVLTIHHALYDGFSLTLIFQQVEAAYQNHSLKLQPFNGFVESILKVDKKAEHEYWVSRFADLRAPSFPPLPAARYKSHERRSIEYNISKCHKRSQDYTVSTLVRLAWAILIAHHTDSNDIVYGETLTGRNADLTNIDQLTGPTITTIPVRVQIDPEQTVANALYQLQNDMTSGIPFEQTGIQNIRKMSNDAATACNFQSHLGIQPLPTKTETYSLFKKQKTLTAFDKFASYAFVLVCSLSSAAHEIHVECNFDKNIVSQVEAERYVRQFENILRQLCDDNQKKISDLQVISPTDLFQLSNWNSDVPSMLNETLHDLILAHCLSQPESVAISSWDGVITYIDLELISCKLAQYLIQEGVNSEMIVPLCFQRSKWSIISTIAVLRAGGTCLLIDPTHPPDRIQDLLDQSKASIALVDPSNFSLMESMTVKPLAISTEMFDGIQTEPDFDLPAVNPRSPAFVVFTSGSTGKPKGIILEHANLSTSIRDHGSGMGVNHQSRSLHFASYAFDASIYEIFTTLVCGGCVCVMSEFDRMNNLASFIREQNVTWATLTNSATSLLHPDEVPSLQTLVLGGEAVTQDVVEKWASKVDLINGYGPAEATICALGHIPEQGWRPGTFGHIVGGVGWVVTPSDVTKLAAIGAVGELLIEGPVLARGYLRNPEKTASSFLENLPWLNNFRPEGKNRVYKSGDLVQYNPDGTLRFVGRKDTQVKLRGQRIELGEVEFKIRQCLPQVLNVAAEVMVPAGVNANPVLVAFVHISTEFDNSPEMDKRDPFVVPNEQLRAVFFSAQSQLRGMVPSYMVPSVFIALTYLPTTTSGKIDRRQLREQALSLPRTEFDRFMTTSVAKKQPSTDLEEKIQKILVSVTKLSVDEIGVDDNIFHLGADSITAMKMVTIARKQDIHISVADVFKYPTISGLAQLQSKTNTADKDPTSLRTNEPACLLGFPSLDSFTESMDFSGLSFGKIDVQDALPAFQGHVDRLHRPNYYFMLNFGHSLDSSRLENACRALVQHHSILRTVFAQYQGKIIQIVLRNFASPIPVLQAEEEGVFSFVEAFCGRDNRETPMLGELITAFHIVQGITASRETVLILRISHAQYDGMSMSLILKDLLSLYQGHQLPHSIEYASHVRKCLESQSVSAYEFWERTLKSSNMTYLHDLGIAERETFSEDQVVDVGCTIPRPDPPQGITTATMIKSAWTLVLSKLTGVEDIVFGQTTSGRSSSNISEAENMVGMCINAIPVRVKLEAEWSIMDLLRHVQNQHSDSVPFELVDLEHIVSHSTNWPQNTRFGSIVTHQNTDFDKPIIPLGDDFTCTLRMFHKAKPASYVAISTQPSATELHIILTTSNRILSESRAQMVAQLLGSMVTALSCSPERPITSVIDMKDSVI